MARVPEDGHFRGHLSLKWRPQHGRNAISTRRLLSWETPGVPVSSYFCAPNPLHSLPGSFQIMKKSGRVSFETGDD